VLEGSPLSFQEAWAIEVGDGAPLMDMAKELTDRDALCYCQNIWRNDDSARAHGLTCAKVRNTVRPRSWAPSKMVFATIFEWVQTR